MAKYKVVVAKAVQKYLYKLDNPLATKLETAMLKLEENPRPPSAQKLTDRNAYKLRVGDYRIIYEIQDKILLVSVIHAGHRREVYKKQ